MRNANRIASLIIFAFGIFIILGALKFDYMVDGRPGPGFLIALGLMSGATSKLLGTENWKTVLGLTVLIPIFMFAVFDLILGVPLPKGIFGV